MTVQPPMYWHQFKVGSKRFTLRDGFSLSFSVFCLRGRAVCTKSRLPRTLIKREASLIVNLKQMVLMGVLYLVFFTVPAMAQAVCTPPTFRVKSITGQVTHFSGELHQPVPGAVLELRQGDRDERLIATIKTDDRGRFQLGGVSPGTYILRVIPPPDTNLLEYFVRVIVTRKAFTRNNIICITPGFSPVEPCGGGKADFVMEMPFTQTDVREIELIQIGHSMLGSVMKRQSLSQDKHRHFLDGLFHSKYKGSYKAKTLFIIKIKTKSGQILRLKATKGNFSFRENDQFYTFPDEGFLNQYFPDFFDRSLRSNE
jgi:hypothetical protein